MRGKGYRDAAKGSPIIEGPRPAGPSPWPILNCPVTSRSSTTTFDAAGRRPCRRGRHATSSLLLRIVGHLLGEPTQHFLPLGKAGEPTSCHQQRSIRQRVLTRHDSALLDPRDRVYALGRTPTGKRLAHGLTQASNECPLLVAEGRPLPWMTACDPLWTSELPFAEAIGPVMCRLVSRARVA